MGGHDSFEPGSILAPAGCGKTQAIVDQVKGIRSKPPLVLTHTNAGVAALRSRLVDASVAQSAYRLFTIDAWSQRVVAAFPKRAEYEIDPLTPIDYDRIRKAVLRVIRSGAVDRPLQATYGCLFVDEYQDCDLAQHALAIELALRLPTRVFGDPMQAIFDFDAPVVTWPAVEAAFPPLPPLSEPWRWKRAKCERLGQWLRDARDALESGRGLDVKSAPAHYVRWFPNDDPSPTATSECLNSIKVASDQHLLIIGDPTVAALRHEFARRNPGVNVIERADLPDLAALAAKLAHSCPADQLEATLQFAEAVMTRAELTQLRQRINSLQSGRSRKPAAPHEQAIIDFLANPSPRSLRLILVQMAAKSESRQFRSELFHALLDALLAARDFAELPQRAIFARDRRRFGPRYMPRRAIGTTLLLKGLEAHHALVLDADKLSRRHLYVAITRGSHSLTILSPDRHIPAT